VFFTLNTAVPFSSLMALAAAAFTDGLLRSAASTILPWSGKGGTDDN
jgi:hypothetical protein